MVYQVLFYLFAGALVLSALRVITVKNPVHAALFLVLAFVNAAILWVQMGAEFLGIILVLVYVGAVMVLFLFVVMMLDIKAATLREGVTRYAPLGLIVAGIIAAEVAWAAWGQHLGIANSAPPAAPSIHASNTRELGRVLYTHYVYAFEIAAVILLLGIVAAISLSLRWRPDTKHQDPSKQVRVRSTAGRVRLVDMRSDKRDENK
ncbi:MAG: NADH-quinone oxidoreductase subunit J [Gammaproteobacteria bacterium]